MNNSTLKTSFVTVNGARHRVWEKGSGKPLGFLAGIGGRPKWLPLFDRLAQHYRVIVPALPGFPGAEPGHLLLDDNSDWICATLDLLEQSGLGGADMIGACLGGSLLVDIAAHSPHSVGRLALIAPFGLYLDAQPLPDFFAQTFSQQKKLLCHREHAFEEAFAPPENEADVEEWEVLRYRGMEAAARYLWPFGDRGLAKRLHRVTHDTLLIWGKDDKIIPPDYAAAFANGISGATQTLLIDNAGHLADIDQTDAVAEALLAHFNPG